MKLFIAKRVGGVRASGRGIRELFEGVKQGSAKVE